MLESQNNCFTVGAWDSTGAGTTTPQALSELSLIEAQTIPIFEEATQTAAYLLDFRSASWVFWIRTASGLSQQWVYHGSD